MVLMRGQVMVIMMLVITKRWAKGQLGDQSVFEIFEYTRRKKWRSIA